MLHSMTNVNPGFLNFQLTERKKDEKKEELEVRSSKTWLLIATYTDPMYSSSCRTYNNSGWSSVLDFYSQPHTGGGVTHS